MVVRLDPLVVQVAAEANPSRRIERLLDAAHDLLDAAGVALTLNDRAEGAPRLVASRGQEVSGRAVAELSAPIHAAGGAIGVLAAHRPADRPFSDDDESVLAVLATLIGGALRELALMEQVRAAQEAHAASEQRIRDFAETSSDWFWERDADLRFTWISESVSETLGPDPSRTYGETAPFGVDEAARAAHEAALAARQPFRDFRFGRIDPAGRQRTISVSGKPVFDADGVFRGYRGAGADITARMEAEAAASRAQRSLVDAIESLEDGFLLYDAADRLVLSNHRVGELVPAVADLIRPGVRFDEIVRAAAERGYYHGATGTVEDVVARRLAQQLEPDGRIEMRVGDERIVQVKERRTRDGGRLILVTDVTDLRRATAALEISERNYRLMVDGIDDIIYRIDPSGVFTYVNPRVAETLGWTADEIVGTHYLDLIQPDHRASVARFYWRQFTRRVPTTYYEFPAVARDGSIVWVGQRVRLVEEGGTVTGALAVARDITARKRAEVHERDRLRIVEAIARNAPLAETLEQLVRLFERRAPGWYGAVLLHAPSGPRLVATPGWPPALLDELTATVSQGAGDEAAATPGRPTELVREIDLAGRAAWVAPIRGRDAGVVGHWAMLADCARELDAETALLVPELVQLAAVAVEHARLTERLEARVARMQTLNQLARLISSSLDLDAVLGAIARAASELLRAPVARFWMVDEETETIWLATDASGGEGVEHGPPRRPIAELRGILGWVVANRQPVRIADASADPRVVDAGWWAARGLTSFLGQPVLLDGRLLAVLVLWGEKPFALDADDEALLESFVSQAALSIRNAQLYRDTDQQRRRLQSLVEVSQRLSRGLDLTEALDAITEAAAAVFDGEAGLRLLVGDELVRASVSRGARRRPSMERIPTEGGLIGEVLRTGRPASTPDVTSDERIPAPYREILQHDQATALLLAPICRDGRVLGTLHIYRERGYEWRDEALQLAAGLAEQAATAIENATRYAGLQESLERARIPARVNQLLSATLDLDVLLREIANAAVRITGAAMASFWLADDEARTLSLDVFSDPAFEHGRTVRRLAYGEGWAGWVAQHREPLLVQDVEADGRAVDPGWWRRQGLTSSYSLPVLDGDRLVAVLSISDHGPIVLGEESRELLNALAAQTAAALRSATLYREVSAANRRLEQEVRRNELLLNSVADGVFGVDAEGRITFVNPAALRMLGYAPHELLGQPADARLHHPADAHHDAGTAPCPIERALRQGQPYRSSDDGLWGRDGQRLPVACILTPLLQDGATVGAVMTFRDISREQEAERQRRTLAQSEKLRALGQLAGGVAHDLNQSLGLVVGHSELALGVIREREELPDELRESLETIMQGALDGAQTVRRLQTFVRGQPEGEAERVALGSLLTDVVRLTAPRWRDATQAAGAPVNLSLNVTLAGDDEVLGWPASLREALTNLVFNAVDAMPRGGEIQLGLRDAGQGMLALEVTDTGTGMPPEVAARVFEPFFTTKGERGTGLGLAMVYGIVERHGGRVEIDSAVGRGTTIRLLLPRAPSGAASPTATHDPAEAESRTILIVDDEAALRRMLARILEADGHTVVAAATAAEALARLAEQPFDLVLSDHGLGLGMNGLELATVVRDRWPGTRFVLVTGWGGTIDPSEVEPLGVEAVIGKPYRVPELRAQINARR